MVERKEFLYDFDSLDLVGKKVCTLFGSLGIKEGDAYIVLRFLAKGFETWYGFHLEDDFVKEMERYYGWAVSGNRADRRSRGWRNR